MKVLFPPRIAVGLIAVFAGATSAAQTPAATANAGQKLVPAQSEIVFVARQMGVGEIGMLVLQEDGVRGARRQHGRQRRNRVQRTYCSGNSSSLHSW